jgi:putative transposase
MAVSCKGAQFPPALMLMGSRGSLAYPLSTRHVEELMEARRLNVDHATLNPCVIKHSPPLEQAGHRHQRTRWTRWRIDETYSKVKGEWLYRYRARDNYGKTCDLLLSKPRDEQAAKQLLIKAIRRHGGVPEKITIDGSEAHEAAIKSDHAEHGTSIDIRQGKYVNDLVEQDHRAVKRVTGPMRSFKSFEAAQSSLSGIELMHMDSPG